uniref:Solute carrier family 38 member 8b n=1 Tax=Sinocyclocheilus anshuiensis TaxID=1608454 RepID=A0A671NI22_9TELE
MEELARESIRSISLLSRPARGSDVPRLGSFGAIFIVLKSALGAGLVNFPWAFEKAGGVNTAITVEMVLHFNLHIIYLYIQLSIVIYLYIQLSICIFLFLIYLSLISSIFYFLFIFIFYYLLCLSLYETVTGNTEGEMPYHWYTDHRFALFVMCLIIILPLSVPKEIGIQKYTRCWFVWVICNRLDSWASMFSVVPTICFGFQCHEACIAIYSSMENKKITHWVFISVTSMIFCLIIYTLTGVFGFLTFGREVASDILMSYPGNDVVMIIARLLFGISIVTIYPIILLLGRSVILTQILRFWERRAIITSVFESRCRLILTILWITVTLLIAIYIPDMSEVISVIGGISAFFIFIFPALLTGWGVVTVLTGAFIFGQSTSIAVMELMHKF